MFEVSEETRRSRRRSTAEVFTPRNLVEEMLDRLPPETWEPGKTFLDNSAGNGAFLIEVYRRKVEQYGHDPLAALATIYGVELMEDDVRELKSRLFNLVAEFIGKDEGRLREGLLIIRRNIVCHDALTYDYNFR